METKLVPLNDLHVSLGAKMVPFAGFSMPVRYSSDIEEHMAVRRSVGVFDVSHMGEFTVKGPGALDLIQRVSSNDASKLADGQAQYACLPNETGGLVDDFLVYRIAEEDYLLVVNAGNIDKDWKWINSHNQYGATLQNISDETGLFAVQGPKAIDALQKLTSVDLSSIKYYHFVVDKFAGIPNVIISNTGYTGAGGFEIYMNAKDSEAVWRAIFDAGAEFDIKPIGLGARDTLRLEMGFCLYGNDIDDTTSPIEAGLGWITKFTKSFVNADNLRQQKAEGVKRKLVGIKMLDKGIPRHGYNILTADGSNVGNITSGTMSPVLGIGIGMGYVAADYAAPGTEILIDVRGRQLRGQVTKVPFI